jgi:methylmalonyl-CoA mutase
VETLTRDLADKAWELIAGGGGPGRHDQGRREGLPKLRIEEAAARKQARIDKGEEVIVGVNKYRPADEDPVDILKIDIAKVRAEARSRG